MKHASASAHLKRRFNARLRPWKCNLQTWTAWCAKTFSSSRSARAVALEPNEADHGKDPENITHTLESMLTADDVPIVAEPDDTSAPCSLTSHSRASCPSCPSGAPVAVHTTHSLHACVLHEFTLCISFAFGRLRLDVTFWI